jgi:hypothetical protein
MRDLTIITACLGGGDMRNVFGVLMIVRAVTTAGKPSSNIQTATR